MRNEMTVICPTITETRCTGFIGAAERTIRNKVLRVEWWGGKAAQFKRDGVALDGEAWRTNPSLAKLMMDSHKFFTSLPS